MHQPLLELLSHFSALRVLVVGEAMLDVYRHGEAGALSREAPVPIVNVFRRVDAPGGAANTAANASRLGGQVTFVSVIGDDEEGSLLWRTLEAHGVSTDHLIIQPERRTLSKQRVFAESQMLVRFDQGDTGPLDAEDEARLIAALRRLYHAHDAILISDYGYGLLTPRVVAALAELQARSPRPLMVDSKTLSAYRRVRPTAVKPNYMEAARLLGLSPRKSPNDRGEQVASHADALLQRTGAATAIVTLDSDGALLLERGRPPYRTYARRRPNATAAGAGDSFLSAFAMALAAGANSTVAVELAAAAAAVVVGKEGTATCSAAELRQHLSAEDKFVPEVGLLAERAAFHRQQGRRIVLTNGCFDILHTGHIDSLNRAKALGDVLVVGLNSDMGVSRLKGPGRPVNPLGDRAAVLAALSCVDHIIAFDEETPVELIRALRPDVFVKGGDYTRETLPEASLVEELGGRVTILPYVEAHSTTGIIDRIRRAAPAGRGAHAYGAARSVGSRRKHPVR